MGDIFSVINDFFVNFKSISISDIIDIAIMAFLIYKFIDLLQLANSKKVIRGVGVIVVSLWLHAVSLIYGEFSSEQGTGMGCFDFSCSLPAGVEKAIGASGQQ